MARAAGLENLRCPECGEPMVSRQNGKSGFRFWGCSAYPYCKGSRDTDGLSFEERRAARRLREPEWEKEPDHG